MPKTIDGKVILPADATRSRKRSKACGINCYESKKECRTEINIVVQRVISEKKRSKHVILSDETIHLFLGNGQVSSLAPRRHSTFTCTPCTISSLKPSNVTSRKHCSRHSVLVCSFQNVRHVSNDVLLWLHGVVLSRSGHHVWNIRLHRNRSVRPQDLFNKDRLNVC